MPKQLKNKFSEDTSGAESAVATVRPQTPWPTGTKGQ